MSLNGSQTTDMQCEAESAEVLLKNITNLRNCGEEKLKEMLLQTQEQLNLKNGEIQKMTQYVDSWVIVNCRMLIASKQKNKTIFFQF